MPVIIFAPYQNAALPSSDAAVDQYYSFVTQLIQFDGTNGATSATDTKGTTLTFGAGASLSTAQFKYGTASLAVTGANNSYVKFPLPALGTADFTIEMWVRFGAATGSGVQIFDGRPASTNGAYPDFGYVSSSGGFIYNTNGATQIVGGTGNINQWYHTAIVRIAGVTKLYIDGLAKGSFTDSTSYLATTMTLGVNSFSAINLNGFIDDVRITAGYGRYNTDFAPPTKTYPYGGAAGIDQYFDYNTTLMHFEGANGGTTFTDTINNAITVTGTPTTSTTQFKYGTSSLSLNGSSYVSIPNVAFGANAFTVEGWFYPTSLPTNLNFFGQDNGSGSNPKLVLYMSVGVYAVDGGSLGTISTSTNVVANIWTHIAIVRQGVGANQTFIYINGTLAGTGTIASATGMTQPFNIGYIGEAFGAKFIGFVDDFRITNGVARYTSNFVPSTTVFLDSFSVADVDPYAYYTSALVRGDGTQGSTTFTDVVGGHTLTATNVIVDTTIKRFGTGAMKFVATGIVQATAGPEFTINGGDFTMEAWCYPTAYVSVGAVIANMNSSGGAGFVLYINTSGFLVLSTPAAILLNSSSSSITVPLNQWSHVAACRTGTSCTIWINGVQAAVATTSTVYTDPNFTIGGTIGNVNNFNGYIDEARFSKGIGRYTSGFKPVLQPFSSASIGTTYEAYPRNVGLLCHFDGTNGSTTFVDSAAGKTPTLSGSPTISTAQSKFGGASVNIPTNAYLQYASSTDFNIGAGDFTAEFWVNFINLPAGGNADLLTFDGTSTFNPTLFIWNDGTVFLRTSQTSGNILVVNHGMVINTWYHFAMVKQGSVYTLYRNGVTLGSATGAGIVSENKSLRIGGVGFNGYIDDLRITKGIARYAGQFIPPSAAFTNPGTTEYSQRYATDTLAANVKCHIDFDGVVVTDATNTSLVTNTGVVNTTRTFIQGGAGIFAGSTTKLTVPANAVFAPGTGDFTIEAWVNTTAAAIFGADTTNRASAIWAQTANGNNYSILHLVSDNTTITPKYIGGGAASVLGPTLVSGVWNHVAVVRSSGVITIYTNGVAGSSTAGATAMNDVTLVPTIGQVSWSTTVMPYIGLMDNVRYTSAARYVTNFIPTPAG